MMKKTDTFRLMPYCIPYLLFYFILLTVNIFIFPANIKKLSPIFIAYNVLAPTMLFLGIGYLINFLHEFKSAINFKKAFIIILLLIASDQIIKIFLIQHRGDPILVGTLLTGYVPYNGETISADSIKGAIIYDGVNIPLIADWLSIQICHNLTRPYTPLFVNIIGIPIMLLILFVLYGFFRFKKLDVWFYTIFFVLWSAGYICSSLDRIFYGGSYDYIRMAQFSVCDLKDIYITVAVSTMFQQFKICNLWNIKTKELCSNISSYWRYEKDSLNQFLRKKRYY
ncbi:hypothetical protein FACS1894102_6010 [Spirochaetia bacterium]|nr:hypothetical protein FACS1894102_6010 [Spirochaetia bacterium]